MAEPGFDGRRRVVIEDLTPGVDGGRFPVKRTCGERVAVEADVFTDGRDAVAGVVLHRHAEAADWSEAPLRPLGNDRWRGEFIVERLGRHYYTVSAWVDAFETWREELEKRVQAEDIAVALEVGALQVEEAAERARGADAQRLRALAGELRDARIDLGPRRALGLDAELARLMRAHPDRRLATLLEPPREVTVDPEHARFSAWYEMFPRSCTSDPRRHGTLKECGARLAEVAAMGFDVLYLPPIHPIGRANRKGRNNALRAAPGDPGSPWAVGAQTGGHKSIHPELGTLEDFRALLAQARGLGLRVALDVALQCSPDHPYVREHPQWFRHRPDGSIQFAENPPKKYQDIYPLDFETEDWEALWEELKSVFLFWIKEGVRIFRVDNPHTKPFPFWEWLIGGIKREHPDAVFLAEAFARPKVMYRLAKLGFTQSYTYFTWRNTKWEVTEYLHELTRTGLREFFRPNFWPNTPDILHAYLQFGGRPAFVTRLVLAATLASNYGVYGPPYELQESTPREPGSEEYLDSEKYEIRAWDTGSPQSLRDFMARLNRARREHPALQQTWNVAFYPVDNEQIVCYGKWDETRSDVVVVMVNLDSYHTQSGWVELPLEELGVDPRHPYQMHDLLSGARYLWSGARNYVELDVGGAPAHVFHLLRRVKTERDFEYFF